MREFPSKKMDFDVVIQFNAQRQAHKDIRISLCPMASADLTSTVTRKIQRSPLMKTAPKGRFLSISWEDQSLCLGFGGQRLHQIHELAAHLRVADLHEGAVKLQTLGGGEKID